MEFRILGPLEVHADGRALALPGAKPRAVLAVLLLHANRPVTAEELAVALWGEDAPAGATKTVQVHVSRLRKALGDRDLLVTTAGGYELRLDPEQLDARRFERLVAEGRTALEEGNARRATVLLDEALGLWRGRPLGDLAYEPFAQREIARLDDLRGAAAEQLIDAQLALGRHGEVVGELEALIAEFPYRERLRAQLMLALYRCDRQADALQAYQDARRLLVEELGIEPGERLRELERAILAQDPALALPPADADEQREAEAAAEPSEPLEPSAPAAARRLVTIVFADIVGSTALAERLDPESMHGVLDRYSEACAAVIERHGGAVEGHIGDAVVGIFGQAAVHEDDALRAVRAAVELRAAGGDLGLGIKIGAESGEVFVGAGARRAPFGAGDVFNVAARLEQNASEGDILLGDSVHRLVRGAVQVEPLEPLALKGRTASVRAWRLLALEEPALLRSHASPFVGRRIELDLLRAAFARARDERSCCAVTVVGPAGIGKSRLALELVAEIGGEATVVSGSCPSYGEDVTYRPLAEIVGRLGGADPRQRVTDLLDGDDSAARSVLAAIGLSDGAAQTEETHWAVRRMLERAARERPLVVVVEDVHWAESSLLDLLEHLLALSSGHPILLICLTRPDLLESRPAWGAPQPGRSLLVLDALPDADARRLVENAAAGELPAGTGARIIELGEGNPLFLEQLVAVGSDSGDATLPSTIQAVLAARIDRLGPRERVLLEHASVHGRSFHAGAVEALLPEDDRAGIAGLLVSLVQRQLVRAEPSELPGQDAFRFAHVLIREAAYRGLPKQQRAGLHERAARWQDAQAGTHDETVGHHLGEAARLLAELGEHRPDLAADAAQRLAAAADAALLRGDPAAGARLLERAVGLLTPDDRNRAELLPALGAALFEAGRMTDAARTLDEAIASAAASRVRARAQVERELVRFETETGIGTELARRAADAVAPVLEREDDDRGLCRLWLLRGVIDWQTGQVGAADEAWSASADHARRAGGQRELFEVIGWRAMAAVMGPTPVDIAIGRCGEFRELVAASPIATASTLNPLALLHAMQGDLVVAGELLEQAGAILREIGGLGSSVSHLAALVRMLAGEPALAEASLREDVELLAPAAEGSALATTTAMLAHAVYAQGRFGEAEELCRLADRRAAPGDAMTQAIWRGVQARILAHAGRCDEAEALARDAVARVGSTDLLTHRGDAMLDLADVLKTCERDEESTRAAHEAHRLYELKGNAAAAGRAGSLLGIE